MTCTVNSLPTEEDKSDWENLPKFIATFQNWDAVFILFLFYFILLLPLPVRASPHFRHYILGHPNTTTLAAPHVLSLSENVCWGIIGEFLQALATLREAAWVPGRQEETFQAKSVRT